MMSTDWGSEPAWVQVLCSALTLGEVLQCLPFWELKGLTFQTLEHLSHIPPALATIALNLVSVIPSSGLGLIISGCIAILAIS